MVSTDVVLECIRAMVLLVLVGYVWGLGRKKNFIVTTGWKLIQIGFALILFGTVLDITDNFEFLNPYVVVGDTATEAVLEKAVGYLGGFVLLTIGLIRWGPTVERLTGEIADRKKAELAVEESEERFRNLVEGSIQGIVVHRDHKPLFVNRMWADIHGYGVDEIREMESVVSLISPADRERMVGYKDARLSGKSAPARYEYQAVRKDGSWIWLENLVRVVSWDGEPAIQSTIFEITERKWAENALYEREAQFKAVVDNAPAIIYLKDVAGRYLMVNRKFEEWNRVTFDQLTERTIHDIAPETAANVISALDQMVVETGAAAEGEVAELQPDGTFHTTMMTKFPLFGDNRVITGIGGIEIDITDRKHAEEALRESEQQFRYFFELIPDVYMITDLDDGTCVSVNDEFCRVTGYSPDEVIGK